MKKLKIFFGNRSNIFFTLIILLAIVTRFLFLDVLPVSPYWDEVSEGYNSYSILKTAKDEYGTFMPLLFRGYDDYKMPVYIYLSIIPIALLGLNEFSVRMLSATAGVLTIITLYYLVKEFLRERGKKQQEMVGLLTALFLTITPWHIQFSRAGFEANVALFFVVLGVWFFLKGLRKNIFFYFSFLSFLLSIYSYRSSWVFVPIFILGLLFLYHKLLLQKVRRGSVIACLVILIIFSLPLLAFLSKGSDARSSDVSIVRSDSKQLAANIAAQQKAGNSMLAKVIYNRRIIYTEIAVSNYVSHFSPDFLFLKGDTNARHSVAGMGLLYLWELPFILIGIVYLLKYLRLETRLLALWLLVAPLAASFSMPAPHALRSLLMVLPLTIMAALGAFYALQLLKGYLKYTLMIVLVFVVVLSSANYGVKYVYHNGLNAGKDWGDGYKQLITQVIALQDNYDKVIISGHYWQPYMYTLFYLKYDPATYQKEGSHLGFGKYIFGGTSWDLQSNHEELGDVNLSERANASRVLVALSPEEYKLQQSHLSILSQVRNHKGEVVFILSTLR